MTVFLRALDAPTDEKSTALHNAVNALRHGPIGVNDQLHQVCFDVDTSTFAAIPGSPFAYWTSPSIRHLFATVPMLGDSGARARQGASTVNAMRHVRLWLECPVGSFANERNQTFAGRRWVLFAKGGEYSTFFHDIYLAFDWRNDGAAVKSEIEEWRGQRGWGFQWSATLNGHDEYFRLGLTWPRRTQKFGPRIMPAGCIFGDKGPALFVDDDRRDSAYALLGIASSTTFEYLLTLRLNAADRTARSYEVGLIQNTPIPPLGPEAIRVLADYARRAWSLKRSLDTPKETSHAFLLPKALRERVIGLDNTTVELQLAAIQRGINEQAFRLYGLSPEDRLAIGASRNATEAPPAPDDDDDLNEDTSDNEHPDVLAVAAQLHSWLLGVAFGRFDHRLATGERKPPPEPDPFDPLPTRSPGMWPEGEPREIELPSILVDDPHHKLDLVANATAVANKVGITPPENLRAWLAKDFFPLHIKMYSKSRRKAPIYWQLATPSASYAVWLYVHAFTKDTFFHVEGLVADKVLLEGGKTERLRNEAGDAPSAATRKALAAQEAFLEELRGMLDEVRRVKPLWKPDLDDGVVINFAPLWRLVPQNKAWQKEIRGTWDALVAGEYDWAHLAMHLWPERVVPKCATDRSLAIAHGLEEVFWVEDDAGKWKARAKPTRPIKELVAERTSPAVVAARDSLISASSTGGGGGGGKKKRAAPKLRRPR